ncbi:carbohydrate ABC transporter permease [Paenibacillus flagellatus]|uniref:Sugar ABC transporter permease n=1 Tax=Paenibacillus flagellatus TaxID=2211139 RepID=A0A2V5KR82_9BACL|nr:carbohydrate ABC transporter permease [Paenibacillus flagellatus]PYI53917.1 sugar ABC transporter permease [Paenibacillus flagellatus]
MKVNIVLRYLLLIAASVVFAFPLYWMITGSVKPMLSIWSMPPDWVPKTLQWTHYEKLFEELPTVRWIGNSVFSGLIAVAFILLFCSMAGYAFAKKTFPGRDVLFFLIIATMMMPHQVILVPLYILISDMNLLDTYAGLILPAIGYPFGVFLIRQFIRYIPDELFQAAKVDGAKEIRIFVQIVLPLIAPALGALAIFSFLYVWNDYLWQLIVLQSEEMKTLPLGVSTLIRHETSVNYGLAMAGGTVAAVPLILFFLSFQRSFIRGITLGTDK